MKDFIQFYTNPFEERLNVGLMNKSYDRDLVEYIVETAASLETLPNIKFDSWSFDDKEHRITTNDTMRTRKKTKKNDKEPKYVMDINESRYGELTLNFTVTCDEVFKDTVKTVVNKISKKLLVPLQDENGYFTINGTKYLLLYQLLEASTYISKNNVTLKSLQAVTLIRNGATIKDILGDNHFCPIFNYRIFNKEISTVLLYLAKMGFPYTMAFFGMTKVLSIMIPDKDLLNEEEKPFLNQFEVVLCNDYDYDRFYYFMINKKLIIRVKKKYYDNYEHVKAITAMFVMATTNRLKLNELYDRGFWLEKLNKKNNETAVNKKRVDRGKNILLHLDRMLDETNIKNLKVSLYHKRTIYHIIRWLMTEYDELKKKDNMDLDNKRLRCPECISSLLTKYFSDKMSRAINLGSKVKMADILQIFKFPSDIITRQLYSSGLLPYDDRTSDMDFFNKFKYTTKGPNSVGNNNEKNISKKYRGIHPSFIGRIDVNVCGNSDPGRTGVLTPFCKTYGLYFSKDDEPQNKFHEYLQDLSSDNPDNIKVVAVGWDKDNIKVAYDSMADSATKIIYNVKEEEEANVEDYEEIQ